MTAPVFDALLARTSISLSAGTPVAQIARPAQAKPSDLLSYEIEAGHGESLLYQHTDATDDLLHERIQSNSDGKLPTPLGTWMGHKKIYLRRDTADVTVTVLIKRVIR